MGNGCTRYLLTQHLDEIQGFRDADKVYAISQLCLCVDMTLASLRLQHVIYLWNLQRGERQSSSDVHFGLPKGRKEVDQSTRRIGRGRGGGGLRRERNSKNLRSVMKSKPHQSQQSRLSTLQERTGVSAIKQRQVDHSSSPPPPSLAPHDLSPPEFLVYREASLRYGSASIHHHLTFTSSPLRSSLSLLNLCDLSGRSHARVSLRLPIPVYLRRKCASISDEKGRIPTTTPVFVSVTLI